MSLTRGFGGGLGVQWAKNACRNDFFGFGFCFFADNFYLCPIRHNEPCCFSSISAIITTAS